MSSNSHTLTLMRHAKSSWNQADLQDFDRPLNARGNRDAPIMAARLLEQQPLPNLIISSSAARAKATAEYLLEACKLIDCQPHYQEESKLYLASPESLLQVVSRQDEENKHVIIVAHNPGLEDLSYLLSGGDCDEPMPTAAIRQFSSPGWQALGEQFLRAKHAAIQPALELRYHDFPKKPI